MRVFVWIGIKSQCNTIWVENWDPYGLTTTTKNRLGASLLNMHRCVVSCRVVVDSSSSFLSRKAFVSKRACVCARARSFFIYLFIYRFWSLYAYTQHIHYGDGSYYRRYNEMFNYSIWFSFKWSFFNAHLFDLLFVARWLMWCVFMCHIQSKRRLMERKGENETGRENEKTEIKQRAATEKNTKKMK